MKNWTYWLTESKKDPVNSGDSVSWFRFYKMGEGVTHVPVIEDVSVGDVLWIFLNHRCAGGVVVTRVDYNIGTDRYEAYFDSNDFEPRSQCPSVGIPEASPWS